MPRETIISLLVMFPFVMRLFSLTLVVAAAWEFHTCVCVVINHPPLVLPSSPS